MIPESPAFRRGEYVKQPTLSRQMMQLEEALGAKLFVRGKNTALTEAGVILSRRAEEILALADITAGEISSHDTVAGIVSIGCGAFMPTGMFTEILRSFRNDYPRVRYDLHTNSAEHLKQRLDNGLLDFAFLLEPFETEKYEFIRLREKSRWGLLMKKDSYQSGKKFITREDILQLPIVTSGRLSMQREISGWLCDDINRLNIVAYYNVPANAFMLVRDGIASALTIDTSAELYSSELFSFLPLEPELSMTSIFAWKKSAAHSKAAGSFLKHFKKMYFKHENA